MSKYQIKKVDPNCQNFSLKYRVFDLIGTDQETEKDKSLFLKKEGYLFKKYDGDLKLSPEDITMILNDYFGNYIPNKKLILKNNIYV